MDIKDDPRLIQWLDLIEASQNTRDVYSRFMKLFCECIGLTPTQLIEESIRETKAGLLLSERKTGEYIARFKKCMSDKNYAPKGFILGISAVKSFYKAFDIQLPSSTGKLKKRLPRRENQTFLTREEIKKMVLNAKNLRDKAIILCMATSGMARNEIRNLRMNDIAFDENNIGTISIRRQKAQVDCVTFISPEAVAALKAYFEERNREVKTSIKGNDFVFVTYDNGTKMGDDVFLKVFRTLGTQLGYSNGKGLLIKTRSHALRKFFSSTLENAGMPKNKIDFMLGHTVNDTDLSYFKQDPSKLKELYTRFLPYLTFEKTIEVRSLNTEDAKRLEELDRENKELKKELQEIKKDLDSRKGADDTLNKLFADPEVQQMLLKKLKELEKK